MTRKKISLLILLSTALFLFGSLLIPKKYPVPVFEEREGTQYWELSTGSHIGYIKIEAEGPNRKSPVIYLHGGPGGMITDAVIETLKPLAKQGHDLYFYDQAGSGHSARLADIGEYSVKRHQTDLKEIVSRITEKKVILIGHSWGAVLAINYLQDFDSTVEKIILSGPGHILPVNQDLVGEISPDSLSLREPAYSNAEANKKAYNWRSKFILLWAHLFHSKLASDKEADNFFTYLNQKLSKSTDCEIREHQAIGGGGYYSHVMTVNSFRNVENKRERLKQLTTPVLILRGQCDNQKWGFTKEYLDLFPHSQLKVIEDAGHDIISRKGMAYFTLIRDFIE
ncbi:MAG: alpha/beta hydrolase [Bacteroidia bacterium]